MNYTINQLRVFIKVVEKQSITKAAEELHMTQPAVSIQLKNFQDQFSIPLTELVGRTIHITDFGRDVFQISERIFEELSLLKFKTKEYEGLLTGNLKISSASTGKYVIPFFLSAFLNDNQGIDLKLDVTNKSKVIESLRKNEIDFAIVSVLPEDVEVHEELLLENRLFLIGNEMNYQDKMPLIYREEGSATRKSMESYFKSSRGKGPKRIELTSNEAVKQAVIAGLGHSILPVIGIKNELIEGSLKIIKSKGLPIKTEWRLIWLKNKQLSPVATAYLDYVKLNKKQIMDSHFDWYDQL
ncbi:MAG: LysR family transcriptional regulator [Bacteroidetes bacterium]|nr:MAG: LysR family transcriptional regulator [Bacteroidota bacterium]